MEALALLIALIALGLALLALQRTGGIQDLHRRLDQAGCRPESIREMIANGLYDLADRIRGKKRKTDNQDVPEDRTSPL